MLVQLLRTTYHLKFASSSGMKTQANCMNKQNKYLNKLERREKIRFESFILGLKVASDALIGECTWDALFQSPEFFNKYKYSIFFCFLFLCCPMKYAHFQDSLCLFLIVVYFKYTLFIVCDKNLNFGCGEVVLFSTIHA